MSDSKRATLITVDASKSAKNNVTKTVRLNINLDESNESKYPELNYKELVNAVERKRKTENGKSAGLDPFSDNDDDVEQVAKKFEQKYGRKSTYGKKGRSKRDDFADIGAGYDENDSFIDNTDGYDEIIPPGCDTIYGGFYINCGSLEFKTVDNSNTVAEVTSEIKRNKRRISSSSSEAESSNSSSNSSDSQDAKNSQNGTDENQHRKKKIKKNSDKQKASKIQRTDSSAATSGKQTSDDSRTSHSDSLTSKPAPSSENVVTSDSSRDVEAKCETKIPDTVKVVIEELQVASRSQANTSSNVPLFERHDALLQRLERVLSKCSAERECRRVVWTRTAQILNTSRVKLMHRVKKLSDNTLKKHNNTTPSTNLINSQQIQITTTSATQNNSVINHKDKHDIIVDNSDYSKLTEQERETKIAEVLQRLKGLIDERTPGMIASYNAECERVQEERKKLMIANASEGAKIEKRLPKRRFPWCVKSRSLLSKVTKLASDEKHAARLLAKRVLPLFPQGFLRMPTLLRQADLNKDLISSLSKKQQNMLLSPTQTAQSVQKPVQSISETQKPSQLGPVQKPVQSFSEPIHFPSSLTVTTSVKPLEKNDVATGTDNNVNTKSQVIKANSFNLGSDLIVQKEDRTKEIFKKDDLLLAKNIFTITPLPNNVNKDKKVVINLEKQKESVISGIRIKSPAALNEMLKDKDRVLKKPDKVTNNNKEVKYLEKPLLIDTSQNNKVDKNLTSKSESSISPKVNNEAGKKPVKTIKIFENNIPRPALVPKHTHLFAKPEKRPPEIKKKKDILIVSDMDPLEDGSEPVNCDESSSDVEVIEDKCVENSVSKLNEVKNSDRNNVPFNKSARKDSSIALQSDVIKHSGNDSVIFNDNSVEGQNKNEIDKNMIDDIDTVMRNLRDLEHSQDSSKMSSNSYGGVIKSEVASFNKMDGCDPIAKVDQDSSTT